jgi:UDP-N-acetylmuramyl pentapeptide phosphotransferase/UDP-N-acetylglucosamine-1-phosphate transferase
MKTRIKKFFYKTKQKKLKIDLALTNDAVTQNLLLVSLLLAFLNFAFIFDNFSHFPEQIPLWYSLPWGAERLSIVRYLYLVPAFNLVFIAGAAFLCNSYLKNNIREVSRYISTACLLASIVLTFSTLSVVNKTVLKTYQFSPWIINYFVPLVLAFLLTRVAAHFVIKHAGKLKIIEYPSIRAEPSKVLQKPTPRGGAIAFWVGFVVPMVLFLGYSQRAWGLIIGVTITTLVGYLDDRYKLNFWSRLLFLLPVAFIVVILSGFVMFYIPNPFGDPIMLDNLRIQFELFGGMRSIVVYGAILSFVWFMWMANMISWNNGTDGQFTAITIPMTAAVAALSFRYNNVTYEQMLAAQISFITLGALLGMVRVTFPPNRIIWGFGATGVGLILASLSIVSGTRVATALLILLIPSLDVAYVIFSRIKDKKSPFMGDRNHLHHKLLDMNWSRKHIVAFYWLVSIIFACLALMLSERSKILTLVTAGGLVLYAIIVVRKYADKIKR